MKRHLNKVEAELTTWIVFNSLGMEKRSEAYIAGWLLGRDNVGEISMSEVQKVAGRIQEMGRRKIV